MVESNFMRHILLLGILHLVSASQQGLAIKIKPNDDRPIITIEDGRIQGKAATTVGQNKTYFAFQGIPFAKPPVGELRFLPPVKNLKWNNILNATEDKSLCVQSTNPIIGSEDCLYINVYTPTLTRKNLPVMVWIYGGGFIYGESTYEFYSPDYLLDEDVIYVSFNYRLGIFGFISTDDLECPGNVGLKDQVLALKWVKNNIKYFGGDPKKVTIFGQSAGGASVSYIQQIRQTRGLFRSAILQSGTSVCLWSLSRTARETAFTVGKSLKVNTTNSRTLLEGLRQIDYKTLQDISVRDSNTITYKNPLERIQFGPVKEPLHDGAVFHSNSEELLARGDFHRVPTIIGMTSNEAAVEEDEELNQFRIFLTNEDLELAKLVPVDLTKDRIKLAAAGSEIRSFYFGVLPVSEQNESFTQFLSDDLFNRAVRRTVIDQAKYSPVYFYKFSFGRGLVNSTVKGIGHAEELPYIFRSGENFTESDFNIKSIMVKLWTNFAKYGNPTPQPQNILQDITWLPANVIKNNLVYLDINTDLKLELNPFDKYMRFWDGIYRKYGDPPFDTYR